VRVQDVFPVAAVAGDMKLGHAFRRDVVDVFHRNRIRGYGGDVDYY